jgi:hypothetical protein
MSVGLVNTGLQFPDGTIQTTAISNTAITNTALTFAATQTFNGSSTALAEILTNAAEVVTINTSPISANVNYYISTQSVLYYTANAATNTTINFAGSSGTPLNSMLSTGQSITACLLMTNSSANTYYPISHQIDGTTITPKWLYFAPSAGNSSAIDSYLYTIIKTGNNLYTVLACQSKFI